MSVTTLTQTLDAYCTGISTKNVETILAAFAEDATQTDPIGTPTNVGHTAIRGFFEGLFGLFDSLTFTADQVFAIGNDVAMKWTARGTGKNGRAVTVEGIDVIKLNDAGTIQTLTAYWDAPPVLAALQS